jgi:N-acetylneuraminic acid mutarotase
VILFGGWDNAHGIDLNDTWAYDPAANTWTKLNPAGDVPSARDHVAMAYDPVADKVILFAGCDAGGNDFNDTWAYDPAANAWTKLNPTGSVPLGRDDHAMVYDSSTGKVILFAGQISSNGTDLNDTWAYAYATDAWTKLNPAGDLPPGRGDHSMAYDSGDGKLVVSGGSTANKGTFFNDTWAYGG